MYRRNKVEHSRADSKLCPLKNNKADLRCSGKGCMAYVVEWAYFDNEWKAQDDLKETGFGWCGMVQNQTEYTETNK